MTSIFFFLMDKKANQLFKSVQLLINLQPILVFLLLKMYDKVYLPYQIFIFQTFLGDRYINCYFLLQTFLEDTFSSVFAKLARKIFQFWRNWMQKSHQMLRSNWETHLQSKIKHSFCIEML